MSAVDHSRILSDYLSACLLLGGRRIKLTQNLGNITRMLCIHNRVKVFLEKISYFLFLIHSCYFLHIGGISWKNKDDLKECNGCQKNRQDL